jgi:hypothetical protein
MNNLKNNTHLRLTKCKNMSQVNLDALIKREDLFKVSDDDSGFNEIPDNKVYRIDADLNPRKSHTFKTLRKADFQRETSEWKPERIVGLVKSFINNDIIPSIILWNWKGLNFIIDGGHRLSALVAWITDDYGDRQYSEAYFGAENITKEQRKNADKTRKLMNKEVGSFASLELAFENPTNFSEDIAIKARNTLVTRGIQVQWINAKTSIDAEKSFFRINGEATPIDETEAVILKSREKPNAIAARAIIHSGNAHKYWKNFATEKQIEIESIASKINDSLFEPQLDEKVIHFPMAGKEYSRQSVELVFGIVNMINDLDEININKRSIYKKEAKDIKPEKDTDGNATIKYLNKVKRVVSIISGEDGISLGLSPLIYFYSRKGRFQITSFLAIVSIIIKWDSERTNSNSKIFQKFSAIRERFEEFLLANKNLTTQATTNVGSGIKSYKRLADLYLFIIDNLMQNKQEAEIVELIKEEPKFGFVKIFEAENNYDETRNPPGRGKVPNQTITELAIEEYLKAKILCPICGGHYTFYSYNTDHIKDRKYSGTNEKDNLALGHIYCNEEKDLIKKLKEELNSPFSSAQINSLKLY